MPTTPPTARIVLSPLPPTLPADLARRGHRDLTALIDRRSSWWHEDYDVAQARDVFFRYLLAHPRLAAPIQALYAEIVPENADLTINPRLLPLAAFRAERRVASRRHATAPHHLPLPRLELVLDAPRPPAFQGGSLPLGFRVPLIEGWAARGNQALRAALADHLALVAISY